MPSDRGFWNRAGRRSGGSRPTEITIPQTVDCVCGARTPFGLLPKVIVAGHECATCPKCGGLLMANVGGRWMTGTEIATES